jgi:hypothetical protein
VTEDQPDEQPLPGSRGSHPPLVAWVAWLVAQLKRFI